MKNYLIIGGTKGIGLQIVQQLHRGGHQIYVLARQVDQLPESDNIHFMETDITQQPIDVSALPEVLDGLVYCPGSINLKPFHRLSEQDFLADWQINFMGAVKSIQAALPLLKKADKSSIVLFSTVAVAVGMPFHASVAGAKGAVEGLARSLAAELAPRIRVNCIAPSLTNTPLASKLLSSEEKVEGSAKRHPLQRIGQAEDMAEMACFLLSDQASWMTGQVLRVDGGMSAIKL